MHVDGRGWSHGSVTRVDLSAARLWDGWGTQVGADEGTARRAIFGRGIRSCFFFFFF